MGLRGHCGGKYFHLFKRRGDGFIVREALLNLTLWVSQLINSRITHCWRPVSLGVGCCQKYLSYITGTNLYYSSCTFSSIDKSTSLAPCNGMAGIGRRSFISGWNNHSRFGCSQSPIICTSKMARYTFL